MLDLIHAYENYLTKVKKASANTIGSYMRDIRQFADWLNGSLKKNVLDVTQLNIRSYLSHLGSIGKSNATISRTAASLKNFYTYLMSCGFVEQNPVSDVHIERGEKKLPQILTGREIELLLAQPVCADAKGFRDKAMLELLYATGIRVSELIDLTFDNIDLDVSEEPNEIIVRTDETNYTKEIEFKLNSYCLHRSICTNKMSIKLSYSMIGEIEDIREARRIIKNSSC